MFQQNDTEWNKKTFFHGPFSDKTFTMDSMWDEKRNPKQIRNPFEIKPHKAHILLSTAKNFSAISLSNKGTLSGLSAWIRKGIWNIKFYDI